MTCPICKAPSVGTKPCPGYCEGVEDGREEMVRAFWASVCEARAEEFDDAADSFDRHASLLHATGDTDAAASFQRRSYWHAGEAAKHRNWAKGGA